MISLREKKKTPTLLKNEQTILSVVCFLPYFTLVLFRRPDLCLLVFVMAQINRYFCKVSVISHGL